MGHCRMKWPVMLLTGCIVRLLERRVGSASSHGSRSIVASALPHRDVDQRQSIPVEAFNDVVERRRQ